MTVDHVQYLLTQLDPLLDLVTQHYYQLVLVWGGSWKERTSFLKEVALHRKYEYAPLGLPLSRSLLERTSQDRPMVLGEYVTTLLAPYPEIGIVIDHIEILFDPALHADPLRLLQMHARSRVVVASWPGRYVHNRLSYAQPGYTDYYSQSVDGLLTFSLEVTG